MARKSKSLPAEVADGIGVAVSATRKQKRKGRKLRKLLFLAFVGAAAYGGYMYWKGQSDEGGSSDNP